MKKAFVLIAVVAASLLIMGIGYACIIVTQPNPVNMCYPNGDICLSVVSCSDGTKWSPSQGKILVSVDGLYPGKTKSFYITLRNLGTRSAKLSCVSISDFHNTSILQLALFKPRDIFNLNKPEKSSIILDAAAIKKANDGQDVIIQPGLRHDYTFFFSVGIPINAAAPTGKDRSFNFNIDTNYSIN